MQAFSATSLAPDALRQRAVLHEYEVFGRRDETRAHTEYQEDPVGWIRDKLKVPEHTLRWTLNDGTELTSGTGQWTRSPRYLRL